MKVAIIRFPGSNCDQDGYENLRRDLGVATEYVWHQETSLSGFEGVFLPGGFSYGDYLRAGAIAARSPILAAVKELAAAGNPVIGVCNGFQVLCESGLLPGSLMRNEPERFRCEYVHLKAENRNSIWTANVNKIVRIPIAHGEGRFVADEQQLQRLEDEGRVAFRYVSADGQRTQESNPNQSMNDIAGILNESGNVLGLMPHPERATNAMRGSDDGKLILDAFTHVFTRS